MSHFSYFCFQSSLLNCGGESGGAMNAIGSKDQSAYRNFITCIKSFHIVHTLYGRFKKDRFEKMKNNLQCCLSHPRLAGIGKRSRLGGAIKKAQDYATVTISKLAVVFCAIIDRLNYKKKMSERKKMPGSYYRK